MAKTTVTIDQILEACEADDCRGILHFLRRGSVRGGTRRAEVPMRMLRQARSVRR